MSETLTLATWFENYQLLASIKEINFLIQLSNNWVTWPELYVNCSSSIQTDFYVLVSWNRPITHGNKLLMN